MNRGRLEAFSDGVLAILITITVLDLRVPSGASWHALRPEIPVIVTYGLSFVYIGIYWNNHHHLLKSAHRINARIMWANLLLLFSLSLFPFATGWAGRNSFREAPTIFYGCVLLAAALSFYLLQTFIVAAEGGPESALGRVLGKDLKGRISPLIYASGIGLAFVTPYASAALYVVVALIWLIPDRRLERVIDESGASEPAE